MALAKPELAPRPLYTWCEHPKTEIRWRRDGHGTWVRQCQTCGAQSGNALSGKAPEVLAIEGKPLFDETIAEVYAQNVKRYRELQHEEEQRRNEEKQRQWWAWYSSYLRSSQWKARREAVLERAKGLCEGCRRREALHVHHLTYEHVGDELLFELVALCKSCHRKLHPDKADHL